MKSYSTDWLLLTCSMKKQKQDFVLILWSSVDTPLKFRLSFRVFFYLLDILILRSYIPFLSGINFGPECVCIVYSFQCFKLYTCPHSISFFRSSSQGPSCVSHFLQEYHDGNTWKSSFSFFWSNLYIICTSIFIFRLCFCGTLLT